MKRNQLPSLGSLNEALQAAFQAQDPQAGKPTVLKREPNPRASTYRSEILTCQMADGKEIRLLCKYASDRTQTAYGHRGGLAFEGEVYRQVLKTLPVSAPKYYGMHAGTPAGEVWLFQEYIDHGFQIQYSTDRDMDRRLMVAAARWLGKFHKANESRRMAAALPFLHRHTAAYYLGWAERTSNLAGPLHQAYPWLALMCARFAEVVHTLLDPAAIVVHGEYYPNNILYHQGTIYPVDWESTAVAVGEVDFASLTEHWSADMVEKCRASYVLARWSGDPPAGFDQRLDVAGLYWRFRWLGERPEWTQAEKTRWRFDDLKLIGERLGLI